MQRPRICLCKEGFQTLDSTLHTLHKFEPHSVEFIPKLYNNQRNAKVFENVFPYLLCLTCFGLSLSPSSRDTVYKFGSSNMAWTLIPYPGE
jgi:hypothetical protein